MTTTKTTTMMMMMMMKFERERAVPIELLLIIIKTRRTRKHNDQRKFKKKTTSSENKTQNTKYKIQNMNEYPMNVKKTNTHKNIPANVNAPRDNAAAVGSEACASIENT